MRFIGSLAYRLFLRFPSCHLVAAIENGFAAFARNICTALLSISIFAPFGATAQDASLPRPIPGGFALPNGWRITPAGKPIAETEDMVLKMTTAPDGKAVIATHAGYNPHGLVVIDTTTHQVVQRIGLKSTWLGLAWSPDGKTLYVSGGNANGNKVQPTLAPVYEFSYDNGRLSTKATGQLDETIPLNKIYWSGLVHHPTKDLLYAANRGINAEPTNVVVFDTKERKIVTRIPVEVNPYELVISKDGSTLYVSNWASSSVSVVNTVSNRVTRVIHVGSNPNDMKLAKDGRLFVACSNDNTVYVIDTRRNRVIERLSTTLYPQAPEGSTPDALEIDEARKLLYVANADNNSLAVINIANPEHSAVVGFVPTGWYPSALALANSSRVLYIANSKGESGHSDIRGPESPLPPGPEGNGSVKTLQKGSVELLALGSLRKKLPEYTKAVTGNTPYNDSLLTEARPATGPSVIPREVGAGSPIQHIIYIIKENRTYDQVFGDLPKGNGDSRLTIFGRNVTPNQHALAEQFVTLDNLYCDGEVSVDGHSWSTSAYATDFTERRWPPEYGGFSQAVSSPANTPSSGRLWDLARRKGLTYRSYGEYAARASNGTTMEAAYGADALWGHVAKDYRGSGVRDTENMKVFLREFDEYEDNFDSTDPEKRLPNYVVMSLPENHTNGTRPGSYTPVAMVASNDQAVGMLVERISHSKYWPTTAIFIIEDDAQDGPDHVDARRTTGLVISPYVKRGIVDSTLYSTSSMLRTMELLLGLPPMSQYDAAAMPMYASFGLEPDLTSFTLHPALVDLMEKNTDKSYGARLSQQMDFSDLDRAPMHALNEILWKSIKGPDSTMPPPVHRYRALVGD
ncbi:MAG TPA: bifunctional YncE family protein/alkaline phosphatase family protein [Candidatus Angelobacter sp.]|nr:bifunctional YncE family protein/alkaline phosphatase family protein [Candidatus Angelobacter sp.]